LNQQYNVPFTKNCTILKRTKKQNLLTERDYVEKNQMKLKILVLKVLNTLEANLSEKNVGCSQLNIPC